MMLRIVTLSGVACGLFAAGCDSGLYERNPFLTLTEALGISARETDTDAAGGGAAAEEEFRLPVTVTFANTCPDSEVELSFAAWVNVSSIRSADQQEALINDGYVQLRSEIRLGTAFTLPVGTYVYNGPGTAGATAVRLGPAQGEGEEATPGSRAYTLVTPDVFLAFWQPPVSCDSVAFVKIGPLGTTLTGPAAGEGGFKTLAQVDVYQCQPFRPGLFLKPTGGARQPNEYYEGEKVLFEFNPQPDADGNFAKVTISE